MHNIEYHSYAENIHRDYVQRELDHYVSGETRGEGGHGLPNDIRWLENIGICEDYEAAQSCIADHDRKWYDQLAVRYYESTPAQSKTLTGLREKTKAACEEYYSRNEKIWAETVTADFVGCKTCGSRLSRIHIRSNRCPVCGSDLRPETMRKSVASAKAKWEKARTAEQEYIKKHGKKTVKWLVKIEYHT